MRAVIQRVSQAAVLIEKSTHASIGPGLLVLLGIEAEDTAEDGEWLAGKIARLRIFDDAAGFMNRSLLEDETAAMLVISQFTLFGSLQKGNRPSFHRAARPEIALPLYQRFLQQLETTAQRPIASGKFGAHMQITLLNDGPVTLILDTRER